MNITTKSLVLLTAIACVSPVMAEPLTPSQKTKFVEYYRSWSMLEKEFPDRQEVKAIFVDLNDDGEQEALATSYGSFYEDGLAWHVFIRVAGRWTPIKGFDGKDKPLQPSSAVFARPGEIFRVVHSDGAIKLLALNLHFDKLASDGLRPINKTSFWLDQKGTLHHENVKDLERYLAYQGAHRSGLIQSMEALPIEVFPGSNEQDEEVHNKALHPTDGADQPTKPEE